VEPRQIPVAAVRTAPPRVSSAVRTALQFLWSALLSWPFLHDVLPPDVPPAVYALALAGVMALFVAVQRWMETRPANTTFGKTTRWLARLLMLMMNQQPSATVPVTGATVALSSRQGYPRMYDPLR
jgi:hypothetical protein